MVHADAAFRIHFRRLAQNQGKNLVATGNLRQLDVGIEAHLLEVGNAIRGQGVVEIVGHRVGIERFLPIDGAGRAESGAARDIANPMQEIGRKLTFFDLPADFAHLFRFETFVHVSQ